MSVAPVAPLRAVKLVYFIYRSTAESKINVSLKIVYNKSDYEIAKPFINSFTKGITLGTYSVQNVTSVKLDTGNYMTIIF